MNSVHQPDAGTQRMAELTFKVEGRMADLMTVVQRANGNGYEAKTGQLRCTISSRKLSQKEH